MDADDKTAFRQSRIYAEGWNAARRLKGRAVDMLTLNPYPSEPERTRWNEGFAGAAQ